MNDPILVLVSRIESLHGAMSGVDLRLNGIDISAAVDDVRSRISDLCDLVREQERTIERLREELDEVSP